MAWHVLDVTQHIVIYLFWFLQREVKNSECKGWSEAKEGYLESSWSTFYLTYCSSVVRPLGCQPSGPGSIPARQQQRGWVFSGPKNCVVTLYSLDNDKLVSLFSQELTKSRTLSYSLTQLIQDRLVWKIIKPSLVSPCQSAVTFVKYAN